MLARTIRVSHGNNGLCQLEYRMSLTRPYLVLSAAAFRRRLLERQASAATAAESLENSPANAAENSKDDLRDSSPNGGNSKRKAVARRPVAKETSRTPEQVLLGTFGTVAAEDEYVTTESVDEPPKRKVIQLSSINPNKSNLQSKTDGTVVLRFPDSSEVLPLFRLATLAPADKRPSGWLYSEVTVSR